ncbi:TetR/AcrR family transcriptional regulator [Streptosporangium sp. NBC_01756]|uniref:TetR/AcrR family transcriptional regulator n=1 Tax=Streptosporangium sp. NBC_01756 TaxID=2975950 RepID=UPI002DD95D1B|nr:TetR/AcrR family transcriptional regulator [Streptosporangium sp. NBC_01756]WSC83454.1 TetR/AcrR family transcriptional regulator [Streptosporangium sp. NBC_01756]
MSDSPESGTRSRTRRAILSAAASVLARDRTATLADIAEASEVGRSTLHRYFPDRHELVNATIIDSFKVVENATRDAAIDQGPPLAAMRRLIAAMVDVGDRLAFLFGDPGVLEEFSGCFEPDMSVPTTVGLIERGQADGVFDPQLSAEWIQQVLWALTYTGWEAAEKGLLSRHGVTPAVTRTFENGVVTVVTTESR